MCDASFLFLSYFSFALFLLHTLILTIRFLLQRLLLIVPAYNSFLVSLPLTPLNSTSSASFCCRAEGSLRVSTGLVLTPFSRSAAQRAAPTMLVTAISLTSFWVVIWLTGEDDGDDGNETEDHGDGSESTCQLLTTAVKETYAV
jgi:hypothetical protein